MSDPVSSIRNLGAQAVKQYARAGIHTADELRELGAERAYEKYLSAGGHPHFIGFYAMAMGLQGRPWNDCKGKEKEDLRKTFDAIKSRIGDVGPSDYKIENELNLLGVGKIRRNS